MACLYTLHIETGAILIGVGAVIVLAIAALIVYGNRQLTARESEYPRTGPSDLGDTPIQEDADLPPEIDDRKK